MKEYPIIMSGNHPKLILDGIKAQTRRPLATLMKQWKGQQPLEIIPMKTSNKWIGLMQREPNKGVVFKCRYGQVGDRLWVRETWFHNGCPHCPVRYKATEPNAELIMVYGEFGKWKPSIFMPRWASRITLEITKVRVERVQEISNKDAEAEGVESYSVDNWQTEEFRGPFAELWDSLNAKRGYGWEVNPWVWVISLRLIK